MVPCPQCSKQINEVAIRCKYCGWLKPAGAPAAVTTEKVVEPIHDRREQLAYILNVALPGEAIDAVYDLKGGGTGFIGITDKRIIVYDKVFLRKMKAVISIPYSRVYAVASQDESGLLTGRGFFGSSMLLITTGDGTREFEFRSADKAHDAHRLIVSHMVS